MTVLVVQKRLPYPPRNLERQAAAFLNEVQRVIRDARDEHRSAPLELADIGFVPSGEYIEVKLYFREPALVRSER